MSFRSPTAAGVLLLTAACTPTLDWREVRPEGAGVIASFPCKPERQTRSVVLAGAPVALQVFVCTAGGVTWGLSTADVGDPRHVGPALAALRASRRANLDGLERSAQALQLAGMTPNPQAVRLHIEGRRPDGSAISEQCMLFARGTRVFHLAALGGDPSEDARSNFFGGLRLNP